MHELTLRERMVLSGALRDASARLACLREALTGSVDRSDAARKLGITREHLQKLLRSFPAALEGLPVARPGRKPGSQPRGTQAPRIASAEPTPGVGTEGA